MKKSGKTQGLDGAEECDYISQFLVSALRDRIPIPVHFEVDRLVRLRLFLMTLPTVAELMNIPESSLRKKMKKHRLLQTCGIRDIGKGGATVYPFWVIHELLALFNSSDEKGDNDGDDMLRS